MAVPFAVEAALHMLNLTDQQMAEIEQRTIPAIDNIVSVYNNNPKMKQSLIDNFNAAMPGVQILLDAMKGKSLGTMLKGESSE